MQIARSYVGTIMYIEMSEKEGNRQGEGESVGTSAETSAGCIPEAVGLRWVCW